MSNVYRFAPHIIHYQIPQIMIEKLTNMKLDELKLLNFLQSEFQRTSKSQIMLQSDAICRPTGIHPTNLSAARNGLVDQGLLIVEKVGKVYSYICCDPTDRTPVPDGRSNGTHINFDEVSADVLRCYFEPHLKQCKTTQNGLSGCCPFPLHDDSTPSFSVELKDGSGGRWNCFGCRRGGKLVDFEVRCSEDATGATIDRTEAHRRVVERLRDLGVKESAKGQPDDIVYAYCDEDGVVIMETVRPAGRKDGMYQRRPHPDKPGRHICSTKGCPSVLYRLPEIIEAYTVFITEGEPDVEALRKLNFVDSGGSQVAVTTIAGGASGKWLAEHTARLADKCVVLLGDTDKVGIDHMKRVKAALDGRVRGLRHIELSEDYRDISHWLQSHSAKDLIQLVGEDWLDPITEI